MLPLADYAGYDAISLAQLVSSGEVTATEIVETALAAIDLVNPHLNAVVTRMDDHAKEAAKQPGLQERPFAGAPCVLKDEYHHIRGVPTGYATRRGKDLPSIDVETTLMARYRAAGIIAVGKANLPELGSSVTTEPLVNGVTRNPWNLDRTVGGSSGGSAAAVAAGIVPFAYGNDGAGSLRIPSSCTGTFGFKPSRARVPSGPIEGEIWNGLVAEHAITRSVRDSAALLDATDGPDVGSYSHAPSKQRPYLAEVGADPGRLRIGFSTTSPTGSAVDQVCAAACEDAAALLASLGHVVEEAAPAYDGSAMVAGIKDLLSIHLAYARDLMAAELGRPLESDDLERSNHALAERGGAMSAPDLLRILAIFNAASRSAARFWTEYDVLLTPTLGQAPVAHGEITPTIDDADLYFDRWVTFAPFTPIANVTGQPSASLPLHWSDDGLPIGTTVTGGPGGEATLFRLAAQLEAARPWAGRRPPTSVWTLA